MDPAEDWEIDHDDPWRATQRTNPYELQAVHKRCNRRKGGRMNFEIKHPERLRIRQVESIDLIAQRIGRGTDTTAIVLPCRYGKSDVIRLASIKLWATGMVAANLGLSPSELLRDQLGNQARWSASMKRYGVSTKSEPAITTVTRPKAGLLCKFNPNNEAFISATIQLTQTNLDDFSAWIESETHRTGLPVAVFIDECHFSSEQNEWGFIVPSFVQAGAHVVLLTATPERADGVRIPGFEFEVIDEAPVTLWRSRPHSERPAELITIEQLEGRRQKLRLIADKEVGFREAWGETRTGDPILCKISRISFDVKLQGADIEEDSWLSEVKSPEKARRYMGKTVRLVVTISRGVELLLQDLTERWQVHTDFQAVVYCGNDIEQGDEWEKNKQPTAIKAEILRQAAERGLRPLDVVIATSQDNGKDVIERFAGTERARGQGDVLIVKQMAGMGLDLPWVKTGLDLSATRTYPALVQRMFRPATPCGGAVTCTWITPDDVVSAAYFKRIVQDEGGEARASDLTVTRSYDKKREEKEPEIPLTATATKPGNFDDSAGHNAEASQWEHVAELINRLPRITSVYTHAELAEMAPTLFDDDFGSREEEEATLINDTRVKADTLRAEIVSLAKEATRRLRTMRNIPYSEYGETMDYIWKTAKKACDWPVGVEIQALDDLDALTRLRDAMENLSRRNWI